MGMRDDDAMTEEPIFGYCIIALLALIAVLCVVPGALVFLVGVAVGGGVMFMVTQEHVDEIKAENRVLLERNHRLEVDMMDLEDHGAREFVEVAKVAQEHGTFAALRRARRLRRPL